jgi:hypothetical protein
MRRLLLVLVAAFLMVGFVDAGPPPAGVTEQEFFIVFYSADDVYVIDVEKAQGAGDLIVDTMDCCVPGDKWKVVVSEPNGNAAKTETGVGDGSNSEYTGAATAHPFVRGTVTVSYDSGVDIFPAGMQVRLRYTKDTGMIVGAPVQQ